MVGGWVFLLVLGHPGSPGQRAIKRLLLLCVTPKMVMLSSNVLVRSYPESTTYQELAQWKGQWSRSSGEHYYIPAQCCFHSIPYTIIPNSRLPHMALFCWIYNVQLAIYNGANSLDGFLKLSTAAYHIVLYINMYCFLRPHYGIGQAIIHCVHEKTPPQACLNNFKISKLCTITI